MSFVVIGVRLIQWNALSMHCQCIVHALSKDGCCEFWAHQCLTPCSYQCFPTENFNQCFDGNFLFSALECRTMIDDKQLSVPHAVCGVAVCVKSKQPGECFINELKAQRTKHWCSLLAE